MAKKDISKFIKVWLESLFGDITGINTVGDVRQRIDTEKYEESLDAKQKKAYDKLKKVIEHLESDTELATVSPTKKEKPITSKSFEVTQKSTSELTKKEVDLVVEKAGEITVNIVEDGVETEALDELFANTLVGTSGFNVETTELVDSYETDEKLSAFKSDDANSNVSAAMESEASLDDKTLPMFRQAPIAEFAKLRRLQPKVADLQDRTTPAGAVETFHFNSYSRYENTSFWKVYTVSGKLDDRLIEDFVMNTLQNPVVRKEYIEYIKNPGVAITLLNSAIAPRLKEGRDTYREGGYKTTLSELYRKVNDKYSYVSESDGRNLLVCIVLQTLISEIRDASLVKEDMQIRLPIPNPPKIKSIPGVEELEVALLSDLIVQNFKLSDKFAKLGNTAADSTFKFGKTIFFSDIESEIRLRRRALLALVSRVAVLHKRWLTVGAMSVLKILKLNLPHHDVIREILDNNAQLDELTTNISFAWPFLSSYDVTDLGLNLTISPEEATVAIATIHELWVKMRNWKTAPITEFKDRVFVTPCKGLEGLQTGVQLTTFYWSTVEPEKQALVIASKHHTHIQARKFAIYERHSFSKTESLLRELQDSAISSGTNIAEGLYYRDVAKIPLKGLLTNLSDFQLVLFNLSHSGGVSYWDMSASSSSRNVLGKTLGLAVLPSMVFRADVPYEFNNLWLGTRTGDTQMYFQNVIDWVLVQPLQARDTIVEGASHFRTGLPVFSLLDVLISTLDDADRGPATLNMSISYREGTNSYDISLSTDFVGAEESAKYARVYRDTLDYQVCTYNIMLGISMSEAYAKALAEALGVDANSPKVRHHENQMLANFYTSAFKKSAYFNGLLTKALNTLVLQLASESKEHFGGLFAARGRELKNELGIILSRALSLRLGLFSPKAQVRFEKALNEMKAFGEVDLWN